MKFYIILDLVLYTPQKRVYPNKNSSSMKESMNPKTLSIYSKQIFIIAKFKLLYNLIS